jgi:hypothetical protein
MARKKIPTLQSKMNASAPKKSLISCPQGNKNKMRMPISTIRLIRRLKLERGSPQNIQTIQLLKKSC